MPNPGITGAFPGLPGTTYYAGDDHIEDGLKAILDRGEPLAVDIETYGLEELSYQIKSVQLASTNTAVLLDPRIPRHVHLLHKALDAAPVIINHNSAFDTVRMGVTGLLKLEHVAKVVDTLLYARLAESDTLVRKTLEACAVRYLGMPPGHGISQAFRSLGLTLEQGYYKTDIDSPAYLRGALDDAIITARLFEVMPQKAYETLTENHPFTNLGVTGEEAWRLVHREQIVNRMFLRRSIRGLRIDLEYADRFREDNDANIEQLARELTDAGIRPGNGDDLIRVVDADNQLPERYPRTGKTQKLSAKKDDIERIYHPMAAKHLEYKQLVKVRDDYLVKVIKLASIDGRLHPNVGILAASATGRSAYGDPPLQQFPGPARGIILADEGQQMVSTDFASIEPVLLANIAGDVEALGPFEKHGIKFYDAVAQETGADSKVAKLVVLAAAYGQGKAKLALQLSQKLGRSVGVDEAGEIQNSIFRGLPHSRRFLNQIKACAKEYGKVITLSGRILSVPSFSGQIAAYKGCNYVIQGGAWDLSAEALIRVEEAGLGDRIYLWMHDEAVHDLEVAKEIQELMEIPPPRMVQWSGRVPVLRTDQAILGDRWSDA